MSELKNISSFRESIDKLNELWDRDKGQLTTEHEAALKAIVAGNRELLDKYQNERDSQRDNGNLQAAEIADANMAKVAEKLQGERDAENKQYDEKVQLVDREYGCAVALIETGLAEINKMEQRHERVDEACDQLMNQVENRPDVSAEQRMGDWVRTLGPIAETTFNKVFGTDVQMQWDVVGNATEIAVGAAKVKYDLPLYSQNEFDRLVVDSVKQGQRDESSQKNYEYVAQLDALADQIQTHLEPYLPGPER